MRNNAVLENPPTSTFMQSTKTYKINFSYGTGRMDYGRSTHQTLTFLFYTG